MQISDYVRLINDTEELSAKNIFKGFDGILVSYISATDEWVVEFFDSYNFGEFAVAKAKTKDLEYTGPYTPELLDEFLEEIKSPDFYTHTQLKPPKFKEYDRVIITKVKPEYEKHGVKKGMHGCIASTYAIRSKWNVLVSVKPSYDADIDVHEDDMELVKNIL
ncbi:MAG: hypothetical protein J1F39_02830 [Clostridiales bacterium]|nr:hypothetical protein [Clostridiales bacterium]